MKCFPAHHRIRRIRGAAMTECLMAMFVLFLVLFGMLQVFYFAAGQFFTDYAALRGARSRAPDSSPNRTFPLFLYRLPIMPPDSSPWKKH